MNANNQLEKALANGYDFKASDYVSKAWNTFKDYAGHYIGYVIIIIILGSIAGAIPILSQIYSMTAGAALGLGAAIFTYMVNTQKDERFESFFGGFKYIVPIAITAFLQGLLFILLFSPLIYMYYESFMELVTDSSPENMLVVFEEISSSVWLLFVLSIITIYLGISLRWAPFLVVFKQYSPIDALKTSFQLVNKNFGGHFILMLIMLGVGILGFLALVVGLLAAWPVMLIADYYGFSDVVGLESEESSEIEDIGLKDEYFR